MGHDKSVKTDELFLDEKTMALLRSRDQQFLGDLFTQTNPFLLRVCRSSGIRDENAEEVIHATWERFFTNLEKFEGRSQIRTFLCGILFNKIREHRRAEGRTVYEEDSEQVVNSAFTTDGWWKVAPHDPLKLAEIREAGQFIKDCMEGLSEQQKAAFVMREVDEDDSDDICNVLGVNVSHLRVLIFRAKDKLRQCLEGKVAVERS